MENCYFRRWQRRTGGKFPHAADVLAAVFSEDDQIILTNSADGSAKLWSHNGTLIAEMRTPSAVNRAILSKNKQFVVTASTDGKIRLWNSAAVLLDTRRSLGNGCARKHRKLNSPT